MPLTVYRFPDANVEWLITNALAALLIPPGSLLLLALAGAVLALRRPRPGKALIALALALLYALSMQVVADALLQRLEPVPRDPLADRSGEAIVVLGGGLYFSAPEYGGDTINPATLARARYAAHLHRATGKPLLVAGGAPFGKSQEAPLMQAVLTREFQVPVQWVEGGSSNTLESARLSHHLLSAAGIRRIYLVTHAWHMPRARLAFERTGFTVIPAPTAYATRYELNVLDFLPTARALGASSHFFHELIGIGWYHLRLAIGR